MIDQISIVSALQREFLLILRRIRMPQYWRQTELYDPSFRNLWFWFEHILLLENKGIGHKFLKLGTPSPKKNPNLR